MRRCLADLSGVEPDQVPLLAPPGSPPRLANGWGWISLSHCPDAVAVAWSSERVGVDLERTDRSVPARALAQRFFCVQDKRGLVDLDGDDLRREVLNQWVAKEAAIKWQRSSLARDLGRWSCSGSANRASHPDVFGGVPVVRCVVDHWLLAVVGRAGQVRPICLA